MTLLDFLTCLTDHIQAIWPGSNLTPNTTDLYDCKPVVPITIQEYEDITYSIMNTSFIVNSRFVKYINRFVSRVANITYPFDRTTQMGTIPGIIKYDVTTIASFILQDSTRDTTSTVGALIEQVNSAVSSALRPDLFNMLATDYLVCLTDVAPWSTNNPNRAIPKVCLPILNSTYSELAVLFAAINREANNDFLYDYNEGYALTDISSQPITSAPLKIQSVIIKFAYEVLQKEVFNSNFTGMNLSQIIADLSANQTISYYSTFDNPSLGKMTLLDFLTCITDNIQAIWPGSNLTANTTDLYDCKPVVPITIQEFEDITFSILNTSYINRTFFFNDTIKYAAIVANITDLYNKTTQLGAVEGVGWVLSGLVSFILQDSTRDTTSTIGALVGLVNSAVSSALRPDLFNMLATDYLVCLTDGATLLANSNTTARG
jgi:hypothetical protein